MYSMAESSETDETFPRAPELPERRHTLYHYDENTVPAPIMDALYETPAEEPQIFETESDFSQLSDVVIEKVPNTKKLCALNILFSTVFGLSGGVIGAQLLVGTQNSISNSTGCLCTPGHIVFAYSADNENSCYAVADGSVSKNGIVLPNFLQKNGLFVRAGRGADIGKIENDSVSLSGVEVEATSTFFPALNNFFRLDGNEEEEGYFLSQSAIFGITGSQIGKRYNPVITTNVSLVSGQEETKPVSIRLLPLMCIG